jgi:hypothetical protein
MADIQHSPLQRSLGERENFGKSNLDIAVHGDTGVHDSLDPTYVAKANILNDAVREIGMGRYQVGLLWTLISVRYLCDPIPQWHLFIVTGFGWLSYVSLLFPVLCIHPSQCL